jgi:hypothetical protein
MLLPSIRDVINNLHYEQQKIEVLFNDMVFLPSLIKTYEFIQTLLGAGYINIVNSLTVIFLESNATGTVSLAEMFLH